MVRLCEEAALLIKYWINEQKQSQVAQSYAFRDTQPVSVYPPTQIAFSRPLGINYTNALSSSPTLSYGVRINTYSANVVSTQPIQQIQIVETPKVDVLDLKRDQLLAEISNIRGEMYSNETDYRKEGVMYNV
ncbi:hypothetical protein J4216_04990 [Candidatus Woesearchaeota archaeon]|nr:hypothetical protein [Candidatus Woesearchaeota archaeon]